MLKLKNNPLHDNRSSQIVSWGHWFALFNIFLVIIIGSRYLFIADWPPTLLGRFYAIISCIGHFSFLTFVIYLILLFPLSFFIHSSKWQRVIATVVATIAITLLLIDIEVFSRFRMHLNFSIWQILTSPDDNILNAEWQKLFIFVPFILLLETVFAIWSWRKLRSLTKRRRYSGSVIIIFIICFLLSHLIHIWADANFYRPITMQRSSLPLSYPMTARHFLEKHGFLDVGNYQSRIEQEGNPFAIAIEYPLGKINYERLKSPYNILMVVVDDWHADSQDGNMPRFTQFADENIQFSNHYSASNQSYLGEFSLFYGLDPNYYNSILAGHKPSVLIDTLSRQRYSLGMFSADGFNHALYRQALLSNFSMPEPKKQSNMETTHYWLSWFEEQNKSEGNVPWFSIIQYKADSKSLIKTSNAVAYMKSIDEAFAKVIDALQQNNKLNNTIVIVTAANSIQFSDDGHYFARQSLNVPLVVAWPNKNSEIISARTSHVDIVQTLIQDALNVKNPSKQYSLGDNLFTGSERKWLIAGSESEIAALYADKTIVINSSGDYRIYDLNNELQQNEKLGLSMFLQLVTENRRFMVTN